MKNVKKSVRLVNRRDVAYGPPPTMNGLDRVWRRLRDERGQGMTEYVVVATLTMLPLVIFFIPMLTAIRIYLQPIYFFIALPVP